MNWSVAVEQNREALKRILASLVALAGLGGGLAFTPCGRRWPSLSEATARSDEGSAASAPALPRHLHRAILRLLRPAEAAARRLIIVAARGLTLPSPTASQLKNTPTPQGGERLNLHWPPPHPPRFARHPPHRGEGEAPRSPTSSPSMGEVARRAGGGGGSFAAAVHQGEAERAHGNGTTRTLALPLTDRLYPLRAHRPAPTGIPRISVPGFSVPFPIAPRQPLSPDDPVSATRLGLRLAALTSALDDMPRHALRFARWRSRRDRRRTRPLRPGRPPGGRLARYNPSVPRRARIREVDEILAHAHALACFALEHPDTS
jgi:hypothetical protein